MTEIEEKLFAYIRKEYHAAPEHLWARYPGYTVFRHGDNQKWFALIMDVPGTRLELESDALVDILNVKMGDPFLTDYLAQQKGFRRGYHISRGNWVSIFLDGTVAFEEICRWLDESYMATASKETKQKRRPPKEWIIPSNPQYYDVQGAFERSDEIDWKQGKGIKVGDSVFLYVGAPVSAILYKCRVTKTDIPCHFDNGKIHMSSLMKIRLLKRYDPHQFTFDVLGKEYGIFAVRGPRGIPENLSRALK